MKHQPLKAAVGGTTLDTHKHPAAKHLRQSTHMTPHSGLVVRAHAGNNGTMQPHARDLIEAILAAADPASAVAKSLHDSPTSANTLLATGKASIAMARAAIAHSDIARGIVTAVPEHADAPELPPSIEVLPADHPLATERNLHAADRAEVFARSLSDHDTLLALISGGGSAHLCSPVEGLSLDDLRTITDALLRAGATINELNAVRKHCERLKGGNLARIAAPASIECLVLSDVIGNRLDTISSGPFAPDESTYETAHEVLARHDLLDLVPPITEHLLRGRRGEIPETPKPADPCFDRVRTRIIASNRNAVAAAAGEATRLGYEIVQQRCAHTGKASDLGDELAKAAIEHQRKNAPSLAAFIIGGETTVNVEHATGLGGRNQEAALAAAIELDGTAGITILCLATDGIDGPTHAAGAVVDGDTAATMRAAAIDPQRALANHDSHHALDAAGALIRTGPTGTNVNDVSIALIASKP